MAIQSRDAITIYRIIFAPLLVENERALYAWPRTYELYQVAQTEKQTYERIRIAFPFLMGLYDIISSQAI